MIRCDPAFPDHQGSDLRVGSEMVGDGSVGVFQRNGDDKVAQTGVLAEPRGRLFGSHQVGAQDIDESPEGRLFAGEFVQFASQRKHGSGVAGEDDDLGGVAVAGAVAEFRADLDTVGCASAFHDSERAGGITGARPADQVGRNSGGEKTERENEEGAFHGDRRCYIGGTMITRSFLKGVALLCVMASGLAPDASGQQKEITAETRLPASFADPESGDRPAWRYLRHLPRGYASSDSDWPLLLYLHGRSARGEDMALVRRYGPPAMLDRDPDFPFVVISPQLPGLSWPPGSLLQLVDEITEGHRIDEDRIYLTGVSLGAGGAWRLAAANPGRFAAFAPICGYDGIGEEEKLTGLPIWAFHGEADEIVSPDPHRRLVERIRALGGVAHFSGIPRGTHGNIIFPIYRREELYQWFLRHRRGRRLTPAVPAGFRGWEQALIPVPRDQEQSGKMEDSR